MRNENERPPGTPFHEWPSGMSQLQVIAGFGAAVALTVAIPLVVTTGFTLLQLAVGSSDVQGMLRFVVTVLGMGAGQLGWNLPLAFCLGRAGKRSAMLGVLLAAGVLFLFNAACFGLLLGTAALDD